MHNCIISVEDLHELLYKEKTPLFTLQCISPRVKAKKLTVTCQALLRDPPFTPLTWPPRLPLLHCSLCSSHTGIRVFGMNMQVVSCLRTFALTVPSFRRLLPPEYSPNQLPHFFQICRNHPFSRPSLATLCKISDTPPWQITASSLHYFFSFALITITYSIIYILSHLFYSSITKQ